MKIVAVIPVRYGSSRYPGKALARLGDHPLIWHVAHRVHASGMCDRIAISTDDRRIADAISGLAVEVVMDSATYRSGSDRVAAAVTQLGWGRGDMVVNVQGDEALIGAEAIHGAVEAAAFGDLGTVGVWTSERASIQSPHSVEIIRSEMRQHQALDFRRCTPSNTGRKLLHMGVYAFSHRRLIEFSQLQSSPRELEVHLEQLRAVDAGWVIGLKAVRAPMASINVPEDVTVVERALGLSF